MLLAGRTAIVTGATSGIGAAIATRLAAEGAGVVLAARDVSRGKAFERKFRYRGDKAWFVPLELTDLASIRDMVETAIKLAGPISILVNNAGVTRRIGILEISAMEWDWINAVNSRGLFFCLQAVAAHMKGQGGGKIVNVSSIGGKAARGTSNAAYAASKAAVIAIARVAAAELGPFGINVNSICPGPTMTDMIRNHESVRDAIGQAAIPDALLEGIRRNAALHRVNDPVDIANAVLFLASPMADSITGQSLNIDNGIIWD